MTSRPATSVSMMLRNRDVNVLAGNKKRRGNVAEIPENRQTQKQNFINQEDSSGQMIDEPRPKRACKRTVSSSTLTDLSKALSLESSKNKNAVDRLQLSFATGSKQLEEHSCAEAPNQQKLAEKAVFEFDIENAKELLAHSEYVQDIFDYHKQREELFRVSDYMKKQPKIGISMRAQLVNWLVELQEHLELNHETLYLAVKLFDLFMDRSTRIVPSEELQLVASTALLVAAKFDEMEPPLIDDLVYMSDDAFTREQILAMERKLLTVVDFDLGAPLSYRFLRRFARVSRTDMLTLTLARYILETSLMSLRFCRQSESLLAAACLLLARRMNGNADPWSPILQKCCGFALADVERGVNALNRMLLQRKTQFPQLDTVYRKYSSGIFFKVAEIKALPDTRINKNNNAAVAVSAKPASSRDMLID